MGSEDEWQTVVQYEHLLFTHWHYYDAKCKKK
jgi:hypothetical protein